MKKKEIVFFDVDGTLLDSATGNFPESAFNAIQELQRNGHICCISTGRGYNSLKESGLCDYLNWDGYVLNNGQVVLLKDETTLYEEVLPILEVENIIHKAEEDQLPLLLCESKKWFLNKQANEDVKISHGFFHEDIPQVGFYQGQPIVSMIIYGPAGYDYCHYTSYPGIKTTPGLSHYADLNCDHSSKYTGIQKLLDYYKKTDYIAFGDSMNDVEMLQNARMGIVMGQASESMKAIADFVTDEVGKHGIAYACKVLELI